MAEETPDAKKSSTIKKRRYEYYLEERKASIDSENATISAFEKTLTTLASGALGFSIAFIRFIASEDLNAKPLIITAWILFGVSLLVILLGFLLSRKAQVEYRKILDECYKNPGFNAKNRAGIICNYLNWTSLFTFMAGVVFFAIFVSLNLKTG